MNLEKLKKDFLKKLYNSGDLAAIEFLENNINKITDIEKQKELYEILPVLLKLNYLNNEFENGSHNLKLYNILEKYKIDDFYIETKSILFDILNFKENDFIC